MKSIILLLLVVLVQWCVLSEQVKKCSTLPQINTKLDSVIQACQEEVRLEIVREVFAMIRTHELTTSSPVHESTNYFGSENYDQHEPPFQYLSNRRSSRRYKRENFDFSLDHPTVMSAMDKKIAGVRIVTNNEVK